MIVQPTRSTTAPTGAVSGAWRVEVHRREGLDDPEGEHLLAALREIGVDGVVRARSGRGYLLPGWLSRADVDRVTRELLADPVLDQAWIAAPGEATAPRSRRAQRILVSRKPGVMDPVALSVARALRRMGFVRAAPGNGGDEVPEEGALAVGTFRAWELECAPERSALCLLSHETLGRIGREILSNEVIEDLYLEDQELRIAVPPASPRHGVVHVALREADDERLSGISRDGGLSLSLIEMRAVRDHYLEQGREPTIAELETIAQTWSEHCKHKTFCGVIEFRGERIDNLLEHTIKAATLELAKPWCVSVFHDNAGVIAFDRGFDLCFKVETHNHPSALDPYGGAGTGVGGVIRDILGVGLGARPIANTDAFFVGPADLPEEKLPNGCLHPRRILRGVVAGVRDYGNRMGIPTLAGGVWFHEGYVGNPLVYCGTVGLMPHWAADKSVRAGDAIVLVGGRTGRDGIHGATFSSAELHEKSETLSGAAVQIGDAITEKRVLDAQLLARDRRLYRAVTDCGAGGLSSAVGEMAEHPDGGGGAEVDLEKVPLKYPGLAPEEIWISEAQERMVLAVPSENIPALLDVFRAEDCDATVIGKFVATGRLCLRYRGEVVGDLDLGFLHGGTPRPVRRGSFIPPSLPDPGCPAPASVGSDLTRTLLALLSSPDIASKEWIVRQYDHEVQGMSVQKALVGARMDAPGDAAVLKPLPDSQMGVAIACGANPRYGLLDPGAMAQAAIDEALRNAVAVGGDPGRTAILDNFSWGNCDKEDRLGALVLAAKACKEAAVAYGTPFISGKDSLNNEYRVGGESRSIPPTLLISALAIVPDVARTVSMDLKAAGSRLYLVGPTRPELGGSHYLALVGREGGTVPRPDLSLAPKILHAVHAAIRSGIVLACHDLSEGGLAIAAAEMALAGDLGLEIDLARVSLTAPESGEKAFDPDATRLYSQSCSRLLLEVAEGSAAAFERVLFGLPCAAIGRTTTDGKLRIRGSAGGVLVDVDIEELRRAFHGGFQG